MEKEEIIKKLYQDFKVVKQSLQQLVDEGHPERAYIALGSICDESFAFQTEDVKKIPEEDVMIMLVQHRLFSEFQLYVLGELLMLEGSIFFNKKIYRQSKISFTYALRIFTHLSETATERKQYETDPLERMMKSMEMIQRIKQAME